MPTSRSAKEEVRRYNTSSPGVGGAVKDLVKSVHQYVTSPARVEPSTRKPKPTPAAVGKGMARDAAEKISGRKAQIEKQLRDAGA